MQYFASIMNATTVEYIKKEEFVYVRNQNREVVDTAHFNRVIAMEMCIQVLPPKNFWKAVQQLNHQCIYASSDKA